MNKLLILIALPVFGGLNTYAQTTNLLWAKKLGGTVMSTDIIVRSLYCNERQQECFYYGQFSGIAAANR